MFYTAPAQLFVFSLDKAARAQFSLSAREAPLQFLVFLPCPCLVRVPGANPEVAGRDPGRSPIGSDLAVVQVYSCFLPLGHRAHF